MPLTLEASKRQYSCRRQSYNMLLEKTRILNSKYKPESHSFVADVAVISLDMYNDASRLIDSNFDGEYITFLKWKSTLRRL